MLLGCQEDVNGKAPDKQHDLGVPVILADYHIEVKYPYGSILTCFNSKFRWQPVVYALGISSELTFKSKIQIKAYSILVVIST
jgi:hypothetical protein